MDDRRFDSLTKALASGANRRSVLKGLLGLGGAALAGSVILDGDSEAARRPANPTPTPVRCPGGQTYNPVTKKCDCPAGLSQCAPNGGPACCNSSVPVGPGYSECCDNACCFWPNDCVGEELCCPRLPEVGCLGPDGRCCTTLCEVTPAGVECCPTDEFCPGGSTSPDLCCNGDTPIKCACGTNQNACIADSDDACCIASDCDTPPDGSSPCVKRTCENHICVYTDCAEGSICCPDNQGVYACRAGGDECCLRNDQCVDTCQICRNFVCVDDPLAFPCGDECCPSADTCCSDTCCAGPCLRDQDPEVCCTTGLTCPIIEGPDECCLDPAQDKCCGQDGCCRGQCYSEGDNRCCPKADGFVCNDECCPNANTCCTTDAGDETCCAPGQCNASTGECCAPGSFPCGDGCCVDADTCCADECCEGPCIREELEPEICCPSDGNFVCEFNIGIECCLDEENCCKNEGCCPGQCNSSGHCCPAASSFLCAGSCCPNANTCCGRGTEFEFCCPPGQCNEAAGACCATGNTPCGPGANVCCNDVTQKCCEGVCVALDVPCCTSNDDCGTCETCNTQTHECQADPTCCAGGCGGNCGECVDGVCQANDGLCLTCQDCLPNADGAFVCVNACTGCADCRRTGDGNVGRCGGGAANCLECETCQINEEGTGGVCVSNCEDPPLCFVGEGVCTAEGCVYTPMQCLDQNCVTSLGCNPGTGQCQYVPISCPPPPNACVMGGQCNSANGQCEYPLAPSGQQCDACFNCDGSGNCNVPRPAGEPCGLCLLCDGNGACSVLVPDCP